MEIALAAIPNQTFTVQLDNNSYGFVIKAANGIMCADVTINGTLILSGQRLVAGFPIIPYEYLANGNFVITTMNDDLPDYNEFGTTQFLIYASQSEIAALPAST